MITLIVLLILALIIGLIGFAFRFTGTVLSAIGWLVFRLPLALICCIIGLICCCTLILIPVGIGLFKTGGRMVTPGCFTIA